MTARELYQETERTITNTGLPEWDGPEVGGGRDGLVYRNSVDQGDEPFWALMPIVNPDSEFLPLDPSMAAELLTSHFRTWLAARSWQVQLTARKGQHLWRLVDCLSPADGGGDRLDADYPVGEDELSVLCRSVETVAAG